MLIGLPKVTMSDVGCSESSTLSVALTAAILPVCHEMVPATGANTPTQPISTPQGHRRKPGRLDANIYSQ